jgi:MFS family permease
LCVGINFAGTTVTHFWIALVFLGLGWNFLFVGATTLLTETYSSNEKAKAQALNDFIVFGTVTITSFSSGAVHHALGWQTINLAVIPFLVLVGFANLWLRSTQRRTTSEGIDPLQATGYRTDNYNRPRAGDLTPRPPQAD